MSHFRATISSIHLVFYENSRRNRPYRMWQRLAEPVNALAMTSSEQWHTYMLVFNFLKWKEGTADGFCSPVLYIISIFTDIYWVAVWEICCVVFHFTIPVSQALYVICLSSHTPNIHIVVAWMHSTGGVISSVFINISDAKPGSLSRGNWYNHNWITRIYPWYCDRQFLTMKQWKAQRSSYWTFARHPL